MSIKYRFSILSLYLLLFYQIILSFIGIFNHKITGHGYDGFIVFSFISTHIFLYMHCFKSSALREIRLKKNLFSNTPQPDGTKEYNEFLEDTTFIYNISRIGVLIASIIFCLLSLCFSIKDISLNLDMLVNHFNSAWGISSFATLVLIFVATIRTIVTITKKKVQTESDKVKKYFVALNTLLALNFIFAMNLLKMLSNIRL